MSVGFRAVQWNSHKVSYDAVLVVAVALYVGAFVMLGRQWHPPKNEADAVDIWVLAFGSCAFVMLTVILCIGPLARLSPRFLPLLYNRRHFGVLTFLVAIAHLAMNLDWYLVQGNLPNLVVELTTWADYGKFIGFPFKLLGIIAFAILLLMAATSHDIWLQLLTPRIWKALHMALYLAYGLVVIHVALGVMQFDHTPLIPLMLVTGFCIVTTLHLIAGWRERALDRGSATTADGWIIVGPASSIGDQRARIVAAHGGERIAVFRDGRVVGALSNLCAHQNGPIGEGRLVDGCVTCPWHGYQYRITDGCAPPPFTEKLATYRLRLSNGVIEVDPRPLPPGTPATMALPA